MTEWIAHRKLLYSPKGNLKRNELLIRIGKPYRPNRESVGFPIDEDVAGCLVEFVGLDKEFCLDTYGADSLQALQLAADVEPMLRRLSEEYDLFFPDGEPYFGADDES